MTSFQVRAFRREDRDQLTALVNAHVQAVVPGMWVSVNGVLSQLEREPNEFIVDPWVTDRRTLVAEQRGRVAAAAHLLRYGTDARVGEDYRGAGEIRWLLCWPEATFWPDAIPAGDAVAAAAVDFLSRSGVRRLYADGTLPAPGVYGLPEQWPHVHGVLARAGFAPADHAEIVFAADVADLDTTPPPRAGLTLVRTVGANGTRLAAVHGGTLGYVEVDSHLGEAGRTGRQQGWADVGNLWVAEAHRRQGIATWLLGQAGQWLRLGHIDRLLDYATPEQEDCVAFLDHAGFVRLTRTTRGWEHHPPRLNQG